MKRRNVVYALGLSMALAAGMGFAGNAEEAQQDEYLSQIQGSYVELFPELSKDRTVQHGKNMLLSMWTRTQ